MERTVITWSPFRSRDGRLVLLSWTLLTCAMSVHEAHGQAVQKTHACGSIPAISTRSYGEKFRCDTNSTVKPSAEVDELQNPSELRNRQVRSASPHLLVSSHPTYPTPPRIKISTGIV
eukprot:1189955-Prorocentrum_minimum.AAC.2